MPSLDITEEQVIELAKQLPAQKQQVLLRDLLTNGTWSRWEELTRYGEDRFKHAAAMRGKDWKTMTEQERENFIDDVLHEDS